MTGVVQESGGLPLELVDADVRERRQEAAGEHGQVRVVSGVMVVP